MPYCCRFASARSHATRRGCDTLDSVVHTIRPLPGRALRSNGPRGLSHGCPCLGGFVATFSPSRRHGRSTGLSLHLLARISPQGRNPAIATVPILIFHVSKHDGGPFTCGRITYRRDGCGRRVAGIWAVNSLQSDGTFGEFEGGPPPGIWQRPVWVGLSIRSRPLEYQLQSVRNKIFDTFETSVLPDPANPLCR
ncbi:hypothetical protein SAMN05444279_11596 [Ruegeria intermedia]|uniref:Uncharacterized protein n=1 Tax=Ruegeria intermedia TaxID=996115 RepID=A0A1M4YHW8_9RHOB|nr:hypothetical protein SAMN05444279_11596 [Ruegeria intermedia]